MTLPHFKLATSSYCIPWPTACEWYYPFFLLNNHISCHPAKIESKWQSLHWSHLVSLNVTKSKWVTFPSLFFQAVSSHESEWAMLQFLCPGQSHHFLCYNQQRVSDAALFSTTISIASHAMTIREWVTLLFSLLGSLITPHSCDPLQIVSDVLQGSLTISHFMTNRKWVTLSLFSVW